MSCRVLYFIGFLCVNFSLFCEDVREVKLSDLVIKDDFHTYKCNYGTDHVITDTAGNIIAKLKQAGYKFFENGDEYNFPWKYTCRFKENSNEIEVIELDVRAQVKVRNGMKVNEYFRNKLIYTYPEFSATEEKLLDKTLLKDIINSEEPAECPIIGDNFVVKVNYMTKDNLDDFKEMSLEEARVSEVACVRKCVIKYDYKVPPTPPVVTPPVPPVGDPVDKGSNSGNNSNSSSGSSSPKEKKCCCK